MLTTLEGTQGPQQGRDFTRRPTAFAISRQGGLHTAWGRRAPPCPAPATKLQRATCPASASQVRSAWRLLPALRLRA